MVAVETLIVEARGWLGTPYVEGASVRGAGADCAGFVLGVLAGVGIVAARAASIGGAIDANGDLLQAAEPEAGALLALSREPGGPPVHLAILTGDGTILHAHWSRGVVENSWGRWFRARLSGSYILKGITSCPA